MTVDLVTAGMVRAAVRDTLKHWLDYYLARAEDAEGLLAGTVPRPREWRLPQTRDGTARIDLMPMVVVTTSGVRDPQRFDGHVDAVWDITVAALVHGADYDTTARDAGVYGAAIRAAIDQNGDLGRGAGADWQRGFAAYTHWTGESYDAVSDAQQRTLGEAGVHFAVHVTAIHELHRPVGLDAPPSPPAAQSTHTVLTTDVTAEPLED